MNIPKLTPELERMAQDARPINEADWGSERQLAAENAFFFALGFGENETAFGERFSAYCLKATTDEMINEALRIMREGKAS